MPQQAKDELKEIVEVVTLVGAVLSTVLAFTTILVRVAEITLTNLRCVETRLTIKEKEDAQQQRHKTTELPSKVAEPQAVAEVDQPRIPPHQSTPKHSINEKIPAHEPDRIDGVPSPPKPITKPMPAPAISDTPKSVPKLLPDIAYIPTPRIVPEPAYTVPMPYVLASSDHPFGRSIERHRIGNRREVHSFRQRIR